LIKPHYEADKKLLVKGRLCDEDIEEILKLVSQDIKKTGGQVEKIIESPLRGFRAANREFLALVKPTSSPSLSLR